MSTLFSELQKAGKSLHQELVDVRRDLHQNPELSWKEIRTSAKIRELLDSEGIKTSRNLAETGFYVDITGSTEKTTSESKANRMIAFRADMDALPIEDQKDAIYCSQNPGVGHMCGHDYHTTVALGVARILQKNRDKYCGTIRVFWQPAEETTPSGAPKMIEEGLLNNVEAVYGIHCDPTTDSGNIGITNGPDTASYDAFEIEILSESTTHSARPHTGIDTVWIANQIASDLYQLSTRITDARKPLVLSICRFEAGTALNIIPDRVYMGGTLRASSELSREKVRSHIEKLVDHYANLHGVTISLTILPGAPPVLNNNKLRAFAEKQLSEVIGSDKVLKREQSMGAEDFGYYSQIIPALFMRVGTRNGISTGHALHTNLFDVDESTIGVTSSLMSYLLISHLNELSTLS